MQRITPFLWFDGHAEAAMNYYVSVFRNSKAGQITRYGDAGGGPPGSVMTVDFELDGQRFVGLNGGPQFTFSPAVSFVVNCDTQEEIDYYWDQLASGGETIQCGWLKDKFGVSWQIVPVAFWGMIQAANPEASNRVMAALMQMIKPDLARLEQAYRG